MAHREPLDSAVASHPAQPAADTTGSAFAPLLADRPVRLTAALPDAVVGRVVALTDGGATPLVTFPGQAGTAALAARTTVDLHAAHIGREVLLAFEGGDPARPLVTGLLRVPAGALPVRASGAPAQVDVDGARLVVTAADELVLRCGEASITLTRSGKVLVRGTYVSSQSSGVNRLMGGSVQLN